MHSSDWSRLLTERQREVLSIVVENKVYRNRDSKIPELAAQMGIAPAAVAKHLLEIEKTALLNVVVSPSEQGKRVYERLELEPRPEANTEGGNGRGPSPSRNVRCGRRGCRARRGNGRTPARRRRLQDRDPREEENRRGTGPVRGRRERVRPRVKRAASAR